MKLEINEKEKVKQFPCLMKGKKWGNIVLVINKKAAVYLDDKAGYPTGCILNDFPIEHYDLFNGSITISND